MDTDDAASHPASPSDDIEPVADESTELNQDASTAESEIEDSPTAPTEPLNSEGDTETDESAQVTDGTTVSQVVSDVVEPDATDSSAEQIHASDPATPGTADASFESSNESLSVEADLPDIATPAVAGTEVNESAAIEGSVTAALGVEVAKASEQPQADNGAPVAVDAGLASDPAESTVAAAAAAAAAGNAATQEKVSAESESDARDGQTTAAVRSSERQPGQADDVVNQVQPIGETAAERALEQRGHSEAMRQAEALPEAESRDTAGKETAAVDSNQVQNESTSEMAQPKATETRYLTRLNAVQQRRFVNRVAKAFELAQQRDGEIRLRLSPPALGSLKVEIKLEGQRLSARLEAESSQARQLLVEHLPALRDRLAEQGISIETFDVDLYHEEPANDTRDDRPHDHPSSERRTAAGTESLEMTEAENDTRPALATMGSHSLNVIV